jgi:hypothetical protein
MEPLTEEMCNAMGVVRISVMDKFWLWLLPWSQWQSRASQQALRSDAGG